MRRITFAVISTLAALVLLFSYRTSTGATPVAAPVASAGVAHVVTPDSATATAPPTPGTTSLGTSMTSAPSTTTSTTTVSPSAAADSTAPQTPAAPIVVDGAAASTRYGPVQVEVTLTGGVITAVDAIQYPTENPKDQQINARAIPVLQTQVLKAQSAAISGVSGATYTSNGYAKSLQSALDAAAAQG